MQVYSNHYVVRQALQSCHPTTFSDSVNDNFLTQHRADQYKTGYDRLCMRLLLHTSFPVNTALVLFLVLL